MCPNKDMNDLSLMVLLVRHKLNLGVRDFRFLMILAFALLLGLGYGFLEADIARSQLDEYKLIKKSEEISYRNLQTYGEFRKVILRPPTYSSILNSSSDYLASSKAKLSGIIRQPSFQNPYNLDNPFLHFTSSYGFAATMMALTMLLVFAFTYNSISDENRVGRHKLMFSFQLRRSTYLMAEMIHGVILGAIPYAVGVILFASYLSLKGVYVFEDIHTLLKFGMMSVITIAATTSLGLLVSACSRTAKSALVLLMVIWVVLTLVWPMIANTIPQLVFKPSHTERTTVASANYEDLQLLVSLPTVPLDTNVRNWSYSYHDPSEEGIWFGDPIRRMKVAQQRYRLKMILTGFSFFSVFDLAIKAVSGTDQGTMLRFYDLCLREDRALAAWQRKMIREDPQRFYVFADGDQPLDMSSFNLVVEYRETDDVTMLVSLALLLMWTVGSYLKASSLFLRRDISTL